ncbi:hypothetical protein MUBE_03205 [Mycobacterium uberis]|uniref:Transcription regulator PadR N-terminal domain-containing protein n=1 Tax=Mycobacterium uberis TaxID=2162698 RepID=A0A3E1HJZ9_9MYCO|nr:hypothetical protein MUBE_03205 [Mycobacterium uberis]
MQGYEMLQQIAELSNGIWRTSLGSVYPKLQLLADEGLIAADGIDGSKKLFEPTDDGRATAEKATTPPWDQIAPGTDSRHISLRTAMGQQFGAIKQFTHTASVDQQQRIVEIINNTRRDIYDIFGED